MGRRTLFKNCRYLIARPDRRELLKNTDVLVEGTSIVAVGRLESELQADGGVDVVPCHDNIVMPGLVNAHNHSPWSVINLVVAGAAGTGAVPTETTDWIGAMEGAILAPMAWFRDDSTYDLSMCGLLDQLRYGTTTTADGNSYPDALYRAAVDSGIRSVIQPQMVTNIMLEDLDEDGYIAQAEHCIRDYHIGGNERVTVAIHPNWPWNCTRSLLTRGMELAQRYDVQFATHLFELVAEKETADRVWADRGGAIEYLKSLGLVNRHCVFFHGIALADSEIDALAEAGCALIHNPELNAELYARTADLQRWLSTGMNVGLGTDYGQFDMFTAMRLAGLMPRFGRDPSPIDPWSILQIATIGGARTMWLDRDVGSIEPGEARRHHHDRSQPQLGHDPARGRSRLDCCPADEAMHAHAGDRRDGKRYFPAP
ncbi:MAG: amidohydrolase family protein [Candidatus Lustribacter sp.]|jgi:5-methylthioadenosine/S-adenosylhomocysteine deaminase